MPTVEISTFLMSALKAYGILDFNENTEICWTDRDEEVTIDSIVSKLTELTVETNTVVEFRFMPHRNVCWSANIIPLYEKVQYTDSPDAREEIEREYGLAWEDLPKHSFVGVWEHPKYRLTVTGVEHVEIHLQAVLCLEKLRVGDLAFSI
jgi:hypothetical protein